MKSAVRYSVVLTALLAAGAASAQVVGDDACPKYAVDIEYFATCDGDRVARAAPAADGAIAQVGRAQARALKEAGADRVLVVDVRSRVEEGAASDGLDADLRVPYAIVTPPARWDNAAGGWTVEADPEFADLAQAWIASRGGDYDTLILLRCRTGEFARLAAQALRASGFRNLAVIEAGGGKSPAVVGGGAVHGARGRAG